MPEFEEDGYQGLWLPGTRLTGSSGVVVVVKRRFDVDVSEGTCVAAAETEPVRMTAESSNEQDPSRGYVLRAAEAALEKPRVDVMLLGDAHAPGGKPSPGFEVRIRVGDRLDRRLSIVGPREARARQRGKAKKGKKGAPNTPAPITVTFTEPKPISTLPLTYEYAYGGRALFLVDGEDVKPPEGPAEEPPVAPGDGSSPEGPLDPQDAVASGPGEREATPLHVPDADETLILPEGSHGGPVDALDKDPNPPAADPGLTLKIPLDGAETAPPPEPAEEEPAESTPELAPEDDGRTRIPYPANPVGRGFCVTAEVEVVQGLSLPCIEEPDAPLTPGELVRDLARLDLSELAPAPGVGPYANSWYPRAGLAGVMPADLATAEEARARTLASYDDGDEDQEAARAMVAGSEIPVMQADWYQEAHPGLQLQGLMGDEVVELENLTPAGELKFSLPGRHPIATVDLGAGGGPGTVHLTPDTLTVDVAEPESPAVELIWRGWAPLGGPEDLERLGSVEVHLETLEQADWMARVRRGDEDPAPAGTTLPLEEVSPPSEEAEERYKEDVASVDETTPKLHEGPTMVLEVDADLGGGDQDS